MGNKEIVSQFHQLYYYSGVWANNTKWMGISAQKCPFDLWVYQEIIFELRPDLIIETGTCYGGSALFMAQICDLIGHGRIISIDIQAGNFPGHQRITYYHGSSIGDAVSFCEKQAKNAKVMVILDSDHSKDYVVKEMECYAPLVSKGSYLIVEDGDVNGHPICPDHGPGPFEAVTEFLKTHPEFEVDVSREKFMMTQNPNGYLKKK